MTLDTARKIVKKYIELLRHIDTTTTQGISEALEMVLNERREREDGQE